MNAKTIQYYPFYIEYCTFKVAIYLIIIFWNCIINAYYFALFCHNFLRSRITSLINSFFNSVIVIHNFCSGYSTYMVSETIHEAIKKVIWQLCDFFYFFIFNKCTWNRHFFSSNTVIVTIITAININKNNNNNNDNGNGNDNNNDNCLKKSSNVLFFAIS